MIYDVTSFLFRSFLVQKSGGQKQEANANVRIERAFLISRSPASKCKDLEPRWSYSQGAISVVVFLNVYSTSNRCMLLNQLSFETICHMLVPANGLPRA